VSKRCGLVSAQRRGSVRSSPPTAGRHSIVAGLLAPIRGCTSNERASPNEADVPRKALLFQHYHLILACTIFGLFPRCLAQTAQRRWISYELNFFGRSGRPAATEDRSIKNIMRSRTRLHPEATGWTVGNSPRATQQRVSMG
jgi:hypothetical protein